MAQTSNQHRSGGSQRVTAGHNPQHGTASIDVSQIVFGKNIAVKLYSDIAEKAAKTVAGDKRKNKPSQLRRFYDELLALQEKIGSDSDRFTQQLPFIQMLKAKVAYAKGRDKVDDNYQELLCRVVDQTVDVDTLRQARFFMEAFMAFYKVHGPRD